ncbi:MAG: 4Fe-4S binding protein [Synergistaceae bacterium]|nr:4Fe-4S binding protein [Synergistaceae bacterium]
MKKIVAHAELCIGCGNCEKTCSMAFFKTEDKMKSAIRVSQRLDGSRRVDICDQCGDCTVMCAPMAIRKLPNGVYTIDKKKCVGCLMCVAECLKDCMHYHNDERYVFKCVACGLCVKACPVGALEIVEE